jgi:hypothetical protein
VTTTPPAIVDIELGLRKIRRVRYVVFGLFVGFIPWGFAGYYVAQTLGISWAWFLLPYMALYLAVGVYFDRLRCPRCHQRFFVNVYGNAFATRCRHCGLPLRPFAGGA